MSCLILSNLPANALAGIDLLSFTTTPQFQGVKNLPPGIHFTFSGTSSDFSERHGIWFIVPRSPSPDPRNVFIVKWNTSTESLDPESDEAEQLRWRANLGSIWRSGLTPYRQSTSDDGDVETGDWPVLTSHITTRLLSRITNSDKDDWRLSSASSAKRDVDEIPGLAESDKASLLVNRELVFLPVDLKQTWRDGTLGRERTEAARDRSWALENITREACADGDIYEVIGELQFCFLMVLTINNFSCLEQWKRILTLVLTCEAAIVSRSDFFVKAIAALRLQLQHCRDADGGLIDLSEESGSLLRDLLSRFRKGLERVSGSGVLDVTDELDDLEAYLRQEHGWQFGEHLARNGVMELEDGEQITVHTTAFDEEDETGEFAPQIVDLTPEQMKWLNVSSTSNVSQRLSHTSLQEEPARTTRSGSEDEDEDEHQSEEELADLEDLDSRY